MASNPVTSGLQLQLDARSLLLSDGDAVASWSDDSGQGNTATGATGNRPTYKTNIIGSNPVVRFGGGTQGMSGSFSAWGTGTGFTLLVLATGYTNASSTAFGGVACLHAGSGNDYQANGGITIELGGSAADRKNGWRTTHNDVYPIALSDNSGLSAYQMPTLPVVLGSALSATSYAAVMGGLVAYTATVSRTIANAAGYVLGQRYLAGSITTAYGVAYDAGLVVAYNRRLTNADLNTVAQWMLSEFGVVSSSGGSSVIVIDED